MRTYKVTLTAAQGGRNPHVFRVDSDVAGDVYGAILVAYRERHPDAKPITRRDIHSRGSDVGTYSVVGSAGAITFADVEVIAHDAPKAETIVEIAEPRRPRLRLMLDRDTRVSEGGYWSLSGRKGSLKGIWSQRFAARVVHPDYVTIISTYDERRKEANGAPVEDTVSTRKVWRCAGGSGSMYAKRDMSGFVEIFQDDLDREREAGTHLFRITL